ncbi:signal peptide peptidase SppA [Halomonas heilongjiangensis]|uniref:Signal peptide peptidase SppA n=1 Tax=Halomonas heilongjiangensis TaxID=1387883 RepID=A0A2N7TI66_9GAMM|nr:signal peptide peptidase SppA [Halomonas heilongjiangensis]PMR67863.1 signal peptide peptidase SppA [Halomonas heilongjiangensis]PXX88415.1 signal peptide peptidase SppA [Halomonas heilongjiangensis]
MSDDKREDRWTDGPELEPDEAREVRRQREAPPAPPVEDAETLRERQRLAQMEMMDRWIGGVLVEQRRSRRWKLFFRFFFALLILASLAATLYGVFGTPSPGAPAGPHLGVVKVKGAIDSESPASAERIIEGLNRAWDAEGAAVVVLHIDSPGGSPVQSRRIFDEVMRLRGEGDKPIVAVIEDVGASGAYYIAAAADEVIAAPASLVGSIGVISASFGFEEAIERLGVERRVYAAGENKAFLDPFSSVAPEQRAFWQAVLETTHRQFIDDVRQGRGDRLTDDERLFSGLIWSGEQALELGLVDTIGSLDSLARERLPEPRVRDYTPRLDPFERISRQFGRVAMEWLGVPTGQSPLRYQLP